MEEYRTNVGIDRKRREIKLTNYYKEIEEK